MSTWKPVGAVVPGALVDARRELHWAAQTIAAAADALLPRAVHDGHTNMRWDDTQGALVGHDLGGHRVALRVATLELALFDVAAGDARVLPLRGRTLTAALAWLREHLHATPVVRDYDMPDHPVRGGAPFVGDPEPLAELARWFANAFTIVTELAATRTDATDVACWPHHFDVGTIFLLDSDPRSRQVGLGVSPGDNFYEEPYLYVTPYPIPPRAAFPQLAAGGTWHRAGFTGAVLTGTTIAAAGTTQHVLARRFFDSAIAASLAIIPATPSPAPAPTPST